MVDIHDPTLPGPGRGAKVQALVENHEFSQGLDLFLMPTPCPAIAKVPCSPAGVAQLHCRPTARRRTGDEKTSEVVVSP